MDGSPWCILHPMDHGDPFKGKAMNQANDVQMKIRMDKENHAWLKQFSAQTERSATWIVNKLIEQAKREQEAADAQPA